MRARITLLAIALVLASAPAWGQSSEAIRLFEQGKKHRDEGHCREAIPEFRASLERDESIGAWYNLGVCSDTLTDPKWQSEPGVPPRHVLKRDAYRAYRKAEEMAEKRGDDRLREIGAQIVAFLRATPHVQLLVRERPPGLKVSVDAEPVPESELSQRGTAQDKRENVIYVFTKGRGKHVIEASAPGYEGLRYETEPDATVPVVIDLKKPALPGPPREAPSQWQKWTGIGLMGAGIVTGGVLLFYFIDHSATLRDIETNKLKELKAERSGAGGVCRDPDASACTNEVEPLYNAEVSGENGRVRVPMIVLGSVTGALLAGGALLYLTAPSGRSEPPPSAATLRVQPTVGPTTGLFVYGTF